MSAAVAALLAVLLDRLLKEPRRWHPLVGFGRWAGWLEERLYRPSSLRGALAVTLAVAPPVLLAAAGLRFLGAFAWVAEALLLYLTLGGASLKQHADAVAAALEKDDLGGAREAVGRIVSRDASRLDEAGVSRAAVESVLENGNDAVFGALFWFFVAGAPGAVAYRLANTLDAMWGYKNERYRHFGWAAARLDDALNWLPARLTALTYALIGRPSNALRCWRAQAPAWDSPNAGPVMAAGAGALGVRLGGAAVYHGQVEQRPVLGEGNEASAADIGRAVGLVQRGVWLWLAVYGLLEWVHA
ncbi:MAG: adenosylcobinamide-phosphate synthase CbiB [Sulfuricellaceae bacterium]|jgi:adenosylcobinamide-phosphate synthase